MSLGGSGLGVRRRFPKTPLTSCDGDVLASAQTVSQAAGSGASVPCVRHGSQAVDVDHVQFVAWLSLACPPVAVPPRLPTLPLVQCRHGPPELVVGRKHPWLVSRRQAMPVLARRRHEIREPVEKLKRRELDNPVGPWPRGLLRAGQADPVGGLVSRQHVADAATRVTSHREPLQRRRRPCTVPQQWSSSW